MNKRIFITLLLVLLALPLLAQEGLQINALFDGRYRHNPHTLEIMMKGRKLSTYNLSLFRSITLKEEHFASGAAGADEVAKLEKLIAHDTERAVNKEMATMEGVLYYGFYQLQSRSPKQHRYLFYRNNRLSKQGKKEVTLIYMEGEATLEQLKNQFK